MARVARPSSTVTVGMHAPSLSVVGYRVVTDLAIIGSFEPHTTRFRTIPRDKGGIICA
jgi:hypothetical protein